MGRVIWGHLDEEPDPCTKGNHNMQLVREVELPNGKVSGVFQCACICGCGITLSRLT